MFGSVAFCCHLKIYIIKICKIWQRKSTRSTSMWLYPSIRRKKVTSHFKMSWFTFSLRARWRPFKTEKRSVVIFRNIIEIQDLREPEVVTSLPFLWQIFINFMEKEGLNKVLWRFDQMSRSYKVKKVWMQLTDTISANVRNMSPQFFSCIFC